MSPSLIGGSNELDANGAKGNFAMGVQGDITQVFVQAAGDIFNDIKTDLEVPVFDLKLAFSEDTPDIAALLRWNYRLVEKPFGRDKEMADIIGWAERDDPRILLRLVEGEGGSGKTRLAAEVALALRAKGWQAGFLSRSSHFVLASGKKGLLILDYPEEQPKRIEALIEAIRDQPPPGYKLRILLLSRRRYEEWGDTFASIPDLIGRQSIATLGALPINDARELVTTATVRLKKHLGQTTADDFGGLDAWLARSDRHRLSLYATAAAVHHVLVPGSAFGLEAREIIANLVQRELRRVNKASKAAGLGEHALARLLALATIASKLTPTVIARLFEPGIDIFECGPGVVIDRLHALPWWNTADNSLPALTPDVLGAVFANRVLSSRPEMPPRWLWAILQDGVDLDFSAKVDRIVYDADTNDRNPAGLPLWLEQTIIEHRNRARLFDPITVNPFLSHRLSKLVATIELLLAETENTDEIRAARMSNASMQLGRAGLIKEALQTSFKTIAIVEKLVVKDPAKFENRLALCLSNATQYLARTGRAVEAVEFAERAVAIREKLAVTGIHLHEIDLAASLVNLTNSKTHAGQFSGTATIVQRAVDIYSKFAAAESLELQHRLSIALNVLAICRNREGNPSGALVAARAAVAIVEKLVTVHPARFEPDLAVDLMNEATIACDVREYDAAYLSASRALKLWTHLATSAPEAHGYRLRYALQDCHNIYVASGRTAEAAVLSTQLSKLGPTASRSS